MGGASFILSWSETDTSMVVVWGPRPSICSIALTRDKDRRIKKLCFEEVKSKMIEDPCLPCHGKHGVKTLRASLPFKEL